VNYTCLISSKRNVFLISYTHEPVEQDALSNLKKVSDKLDLGLSYQALRSRLYRAKLRTGKKLIRLEDNTGKKITIEIKEVE